MTTRLIITVAVIVAVTVVTMVMNRRRTPSGPTITGTELPSHVRREDFVAPDSPYLVVVFSSASCMACADVWSWVKTLESSTVAVQDVEAKDEPEIHDRYRIDSVPATLVVDRFGVVVHHVLGPLGPAEQVEITRRVQVTQSGGTV